MPLWERNGALVSNADRTALLECDDCPCDEGVICSDCPDAMPETVLVDLGDWSFPTKVCAACDTVPDGEHELPTNPDVFPEVCGYRVCKFLCSATSGFPPVTSYYVMHITAGVIDSGAQRIFTVSVAFYVSSSDPRPDNLCVPSIGGSYEYRLTVDKATDPDCQGTRSLSFNSRSGGTIPCDTVTPPASVSLTISL